MQKAFLKNKWLNFGKTVCSTHGLQQKSKSQPRLNAKRIFKQETVKFLAKCSF